MVGDMVGETVGEHDFGARLRRLLDHRRLRPAALARHVDVPERELTVVLHGGEAPAPPLLRRLAPALGLHTADVFAIAGTDTPDDLTPVDTTAGRAIPRVLQDAAALPPQQYDTLRRYVASLPQAERTRPVPETPPGRRYPPGPGALLMSMLHNRNLNWPAIAITFGTVTYRYWAASTFGQVGHGRKPLTPDLLADYAVLLDVPADDLSALTAIPLPTPGTPKPDTPAVADLIWELRRLTVSQLHQVTDTAKALRTHPPDD
ncbi:MULTISPECIES: helix-turn-helix domain-containing protein [Streptomyces]|uniref:Helix-turn-helix domain-containing protein n=2 Tax=Streptomyces TaxID=1883 RepID=A0ABU4MMS7_9ACTN|nr:MULTISPECIES: helix-turn-helix domain-containing protein [Streptomyces]MDX2941658.1 helix-turn-helix domain-containing protein [Streptomyces caniscabiei]MDX2951963.1 helix-turn-helix domain-containing protein [Streptomyces caniscabiei]MDX2985878.1 helix-turn-helix domain-containing protein [Streptomyces caniscabiei]MDX3012019.1 helix-turn-helix domain-containing protein [Streptomyces caniscabiei]MDX3038576.1 helix-turn-helix domain-containing protein [Streptomyces caniscabiei]